MTEKQPYILWLPSWYPTKLQPYNGDFIQRHAKAAAIYKNIEVIYVVKDEEGKVTKSVTTEVTISDKLKETIIYYYQPASRYKYLSKLQSYLKYIQLYKKIIREQFETNGKPQLVNVVIALKAGTIGRWIKKTYGVDYVLTEHWTIYLKEAVPNFYSLPLYSRILCRKIFQEAKGISVVSNYLGNRLQDIFAIPSFRVIPNVVDINVFNYSDSVKKQGNRFIHISSLGYQKNPEDIIKAFGIVRKKGFEFVLDIIGPPMPYLREMARTCGVEDFVAFHDEMPQTQLAHYLRESDALILYSRYETFGCVLIEAFACGVPVIVSNLPVLREIVIENFNGLFTEVENSIALSNAIISYILNKDLFNSQQIAEASRAKFNYGYIGVLLNEWFDN